mgnify:CR=1 FL=1
MTELLQDLIDLIHGDEGVVHGTDGTHDGVIPGHAAHDLIPVQLIQRQRHGHRHAGRGLDDEDVLGGDAGEELPDYLR